MVYIAILLLLIVIAIGLLSDEEFTCISDAWYTMKTVFAAFMALIAMFTVIPALDVTPERWTFLAFLMCALIAFVGVAGDYKANDDIRKVHLASAWLSAICSVAWTIAVCPWSLLCGLFALPALHDKKMWLLYLELACFAMVYISIICLT